jgi:hypothetical protein
MQGKNIEKFCSYFEEQIHKIENLKEPLYQKILIITLMDTLSRVWSQGVTQNKKRFINLITNCIQWEHRERVSIPMTYYRLVDRKDVSTILTEYFQKLINQLDYGKIYRLEIDPFFSEIEHLIKTNEEKDILVKSRHLELLYIYRNHLVHEFRKPGHGMEFSDNNESPYYHGMTNLSLRKDTWELVYPTRFLMNFSKIALSNIKKFLLQNNFDPYSYFQFGSPWS